MYDAAYLLENKDGKGDVEEEAVHRHISREDAIPDGGQKAEGSYGILQPAISAKSKRILVEGMQEVDA